MNELSVARKRLKVARDNHVDDLDKEISALAEAENGLKERLHQLNQKKHEISQANGNIDAAVDDLVEVNAGGKIIVAKRSTLIQIQGTRLEALFSIRSWHGTATGASSLTLILPASRLLSII